MESLKKTPPPILKHAFQGLDSWIAALIRYQGSLDPEGTVMPCYMATPEDYMEIVQALSNMAGGETPQTSNTCTVFMGCQIRSWRKAGQRSVFMAALGPAQYTRAVPAAT